MKKLLSAILITILLLQVLSLSISAATTISYEETFTVSYDAEDNFSTFHNPLYSNSSAGMYRYYDQLSTNLAKKIYSAMTGFSAEVKSLEIDSDGELIFYSATTSPTSEEKAETMDKISVALDGAFKALRLDYPELFWFSSASINISTSGKYDFTTRKYLWSVKTLTVSYVLASQYTDGLASMITALKNKIDSIEVVGNNNYEKAKYIHDLLCTTTVYDLYYTYAHEPVGTLLYGKAVCEGYAEAFKLICDKYNIPCALIIGTGHTSTGSEGHMWNAVRLEDGIWYGLDVTWDDQYSIFYDYFLVGSASIPTNFQSITFNASHVADDAFAYPTLSETKFDTSYYDKPNIDNPYDLALTLTDDSSYSIDTVNKYLRGVEPAVTDVDLISNFKGSRVKVIPSKDNLIGTGSIVQLYDESGKTLIDSLVVIVRGDVDGDAVISVTDYIRVKRSCQRLFDLYNEFLDAANTDNMAGIQTTDYLQIKRHFQNSFDLFA